MNRQCILWVVLLTLASAPAVWSQLQDDMRPGREDVEGMMEAYILSKLQEALELSDEQFGQMVVAQKKLQDVRRRYRRERMETIRQMRQILRHEDGEEDELTTFLERLDTLRADFLKEEDERYDAIDAILDVKQRARYRILEVEIQRRLQQLMRRARGQGERPRRQFP